MSRRSRGPSLRTGCATDLGNRGLEIDFGLPRETRLGRRTDHRRWTCHEFLGRICRRSMGCSHRLGCFAVSDRGRGVGRGRAGAGSRFRVACVRAGRLIGLDRRDRPAKSVTVRLPADAVGLSVLNRRGVALDADPELDAEVERFLVGQPELSAKLVDADLLGQLAVRSSLQGARGEPDGHRRGLLSSHIGAGLANEMQDSALGCTGFRGAARSGGRSKQDATKSRV